METEKNNASGSSTSLLQRVHLFGLDICVVGFAEAAAHLFSVVTTARAADRQQQLLRLPSQPPAMPARVVVTPNVDHLIRLDKNPTFKQTYAQADYIFADGMPVVWASHFSAQKLPGRVTGADLFVALARKAQQEQVPIFVIGGVPGEEAALLAAFETVYPGLQVAIYAPSMQFDPVGDEGLEALHRVNQAKPGIVFVCLGMPKQEIWALSHRTMMHAPLVLCVGAAMEFALNFKKRAPKWMQQAGMEWIWRMASEPRRLWRRYLVQGAGFIPLLWQQTQQSRRERREPR
jgi:N-acetylglucosaminyldiphosphoundecaprenol N-acetyl-beta-D-mannosaminyltransferase